MHKADASLFLALLSSGQIGVVTNLVLVSSKVTFNTKMDRFCISEDLSSIFLCGYLPAESCTCSFVFVFQVTEEYVEDGAWKRKKGEV